MNVAALIVRTASRSYAPPIAFSFSRPSLGRNNTGSPIRRVGLRKLCVARTGRREEEDDHHHPEMDKARKSNAGDDQENKEAEGEHLKVKAGDVMEHSFGEGYATRSDEEGFGGIYGGNDSWKMKKPGEIDEDHPEYDKSQGSEVKEKEKARFQKHASS